MSVLPDFGNWLRLWKFHGEFSAFRACFRTFAVGRDYFFIYANIFTQYFSIIFWQFFIFIEFKIKHLFCIVFQTKILVPNLFRQFEGISKNNDIRNV